MAKRKFTTKRAGAGPRSAAQIQRNAPEMKLAHVIERERRVLMKVQALLQCAAIAMDRCPGPQATAPDYADALALATEQLDALLDRLDSVALARI